MFRCSIFCIHCQLGSTISLKQWMNNFFKSTQHEKTNRFLKLTLFNTNERKNELNLRAAQNEAKSTCWSVSAASMVGRCVRSRSPCRSPCSTANSANSSVGSTRRQSQCAMYDALNPPLLHWLECIEFSNLKSVADKTYLLNVRFDSVDQLATVPDLQTLIQAANK